MGSINMQLELTFEEARVLHVAIDHIFKSKELLENTYAGDERDVVKFRGLAGRLRALYEMEQKKTQGGT
jgi:hypothetical protein